MLKKILNLARELKSLTIPAVGPKNAVIKIYAQIWLNPDSTGIEGALYNKFLICCEAYIRRIVVPTLRTFI